MTISVILALKLMHESDAKWNGLDSFDNYDLVVVGSGCTALAFIDETLRLNPHKKILCLERGGESS